MIKQATNSVTALLVFCSDFFQTSSSAAQTVTNTDIVLEAEYLHSIWLGDYDNQEQVSLAAVGCNAKHFYWCD